MQTSVTMSKATVLLNFENYCTLIFCYKSNLLWWLFKLRYIHILVYRYLTYNKIKFDNENLVSIWDYIMCVFNNTHSTTCTYRSINNPIAYFKVREDSDFVFW